MSKIHELAELGQAVWLDYIRRSFLTTDKMKHYIELGLRGMTSNPSIFEKAITKSEDYDEQLKQLVAKGLATEEVYLQLIREDIQAAADLLRPVYDETEGLDGYVSLEVNPTLAHDTEATNIEARRLWKLIDRPNLMIKIPGTKEGLPAITQATQEGINVNITLIFSLARYAEVIAAFLKGMEYRLRTGEPVDGIASVASFFVSRVDTKVDHWLDEVKENRSGRLTELAKEMHGKAAVANAKLAYRQFMNVFLSDEYAEFRDAGARVQRPLWASTSTKNPAYSDIKYVEELIAPHTVNTMPEKTLDAFLDHGEVEISIEDNWDEPHFVMQSLQELGVSMEEVTQELEDEGVAAFADSFRSLMISLEEKASQLRRAEKKTLPDRGLTKADQGVDEKLEEGKPPVSILGESEPIKDYRNWDLQTHLGDFENNLAPWLEEMQAQRILPRIWDIDYKVWGPQREEVANRLGWLDIIPRMQEQLQNIQELREGLRSEGYTDALLLGMGGSSLAPELFARTFPREGDQGLTLQVLDSTDPGAILRMQETLNPNKTLFIVSSKSGSTVETISLFKFFYNWTLETIEGEVKNPELAGQHFIAITDPGSNLVALGEEYGFRQIFLADMNIGGRYSALSPFGIVPAVLSGVPADRILARAEGMAQATGPEVPVAENPAARLGLILGEMAKAGRDKLTFVLPEALQSFGDWVEQLIAESTGKHGTGILPVVGEPLGVPAVYGDDRLFVAIQLGDLAAPQAFEDIEDSGFPIIRIQIDDLYDLGALFFLWEMATAVAGYRLGINPFNQPNVESAKARARELVTIYKETGKLPASKPLFSEDGLTVYGPEEVESLQAEWNLEGDNPEEALTYFLSQAKPGGYIALQAFLTPSKATTKALQDLRVHLRDQYRLATTVGYGPRFLHSTGQLHKGDAGKGMFIQFTQEVTRDAEIPDKAGSEGSAISFGTLELAQALGDRQALLEAGRKVLRFHITGDVPDKIERLRNAVEAA